MTRLRTPRADGRRRDRGAAAVEFALCVLPLFYLLCGTVDFARAYNTHIVLTEVAAEGARALAVPGTSPGTAIARAGVATTGSVVKQSALTFPRTTGCTSTGNGQAQMRVTTTFTMITPIPVVKKQFPLVGVGVQTCGT